MQRKYLFITGGVFSSLGKGLTSAAVALLLEKKGLKVSILKLDPYLNVDPGTMNPFQHGEVYVTDDGAETDLDLGHYFRYTNSPLSRASNVTSGQIYNSVIRRERRGDYLGNTVQVIPHITVELNSRITHCADQVKGTNIVLIEIGGTIGDIESLPFLEAIRQFRAENAEHCMNIHLTYVPYLKAAGELKTKPSQHSVQALREIGIVPDMILCRSESHLPESIRQKISLFCSVPFEHVLEEVDVKDTIYEVPLRLHEQKIDSLICKKLGLANPPIDLSVWENILETIRHPKGTITVGVVGKYVTHKDAYKSVFESLEHGAIAHGYKIKIKSIEADKIDLDKDIHEELQNCDAYLVPGGFGERGWEGKIRTAQYCRENRIPYFGICLGMQVLVVEYARNVAMLKDANSTEIVPDTKEPLISLLSEQRGITELGGTMRLGAYPCKIKAGSLAAKAYNSSTISERHRHRYEFNSHYKEILEEKGLVFSGVWEEGSLYEIAEISDNPWMVGVQYHPEFLSKPTNAHPLFKDFIGAAIANKKTSCE